MKVVRAYRFALDLTAAQERAVLSHCGAARVAYNWGLARVKAVADQRAAERTYGVAEADLTPAVGWSLAALRRAWNAAKKEVLTNWSDSHRKHVTLPRLGRLKTHESTRKLARRIEAGTARVVSATVRREGGRWFISFTCEVDQADRTPARPNTVIGVDLGVTCLAVLSTGEQVPNPRHLGSASRRLPRLSRAASRKIGRYDPATRTRRPPSRRWRTANAALGRAHARVANLRRDGLHQLTTALAAKYGTVVVEDLHVAGMLRNRRLARYIADAGFGEIRRQLDYKTEWCGGRLVVADRWYPSSKTCSGCGAVKAKLPLSERTYTCTTCGLSLDRDLNAARNLAALAATVAGSGPETLNGRGADRKTRPGGLVAVKRQSGTASAGKTGTVPPQGRTSDHVPTYAS